MATVLLNGESVPVREGTLLSDVLASRAPVETPCGGGGRCGKCRVTARGALSSLSAEEETLLTAQERARGVRLACRTRVLGDCEVFTAGQTEARILAGTGGGGAHAPMFAALGAAVDIGTTTIAAALYARDGTMLAQAGTMNPQARWGADVISRIGAALGGGAAPLAAAVRGAVDGLLGEMAGRAGVRAEEIDALVVTGNTAMLYLLTQTDPDCLSHAPFEATRLFGETLTGAALGLCCAQAAVYLPRCLSAFVGADTATALLASGIAEKDGVRMMADIGTNGEIALWTGTSLVCCSTAAGPAFEGAGISMGMSGRDGAVDHVRVRGGALEAHVLGGGRAAGICGSGVVDALACLLDTGRMDETGLLEENPAVVCGGVVLTQKDVRAVQLAKSAIAAGIFTLAESVQVPLERVEELAVAGGFGSYLDVERAGRIGLIPAELVPRVRVVGNAALDGAAMLLLDKTRVPACEALARRARTEDLTSSAQFLQYYTDGMFFE